jgi:selenocysteine lyase/cysteine desulfurase
MTEEDILHNVEFGRTCHGGYGDIIGGKPTGAVRISFGYMTKYREIDAFVKFLKEEFIETRAQCSLTEISLIE